MEAAETGKTNQSGGRARVHVGLSCKPNFFLRFFFFLCSVTSPERLRIQYYCRSCSDLRRRFRRAESQAALGHKGQPGGCAGGGGAGGSVGCRRIRLALPPAAQLGTARVRCHPRRIGPCSDKWVVLGSRWFGGREDLLVLLVDMIR